MPTRRIFFSFALASQHSLVLLDVNLHLTLQINVVATECILVLCVRCKFLVGTIIPSWLAIFLLISYSSLFVPHKKAIILNSPPPPCPVDTIYYGGCVAQCYPINASTTTSLETNTPHYYFLFSSISYSTVLKLLAKWLRLFVQKLHQPALASVTTSFFILLIVVVVIIAQR